MHQLMAVDTETVLVVSINNLGPGKAWTLAELADDTTLEGGAWCAGG